jgi:uncharacterized damage-inducible protein DinB
MSGRPEGVRGEFLWELEIAERQIVAIAEAIPAEKYEWRPDPKARSISEVFVHVAAGIFMILDFIGTAAPDNLYGGVASHSEERFAGLIRRNDELEKSLREKSAVTNVLKQSIETLRGSLNRADEREFARGLHFFGEQTTVRRVYLRLLAHTHEHMGQMIAYLRSNNMSPPWPDWRPDRR